MGNKLTFCLTVVLLLLSFNLWGFQFKRVENQIHLTMSLYVDGTQLTNNENKIANICNELTNEYKKSKDHYALMLFKFFKTASNKTTLNQKINNLLTVINKTEKKHTRLIAYANYQLAALLIQNRSFRNALQYNKNVLLLLKQEKDAELEKLTYNQIGLIEFHLKNYNKAKESFINAYYRDENASPFFLATILSNIAACDFLTEKYQNAEKSFIKAIHLLENSSSQSEQQFRALLRGNLGSTYKKLGKIDLAVINLSYEVDFNSSNDLYPSYVNESLGDLLSIYLERADKEKLKKLLLNIHVHGKHQQSPTAILEYKELLLKYHTYMGDKAKALNLAKEIIDLQKKIKENVESKTEKVSNAFYSNKIDFINHEFRNEELLFDNELKQKMNINYTIILFSVIVILLLLYLLKQRNLKLKNTEMINLQALEIENVKRKIAEKELRLKREVVSNLSLFLNLKMETEKTFLKNLKDLKRRKYQDVESIFKELQNSVIALMNLDKSNLEVLNVIEYENSEIIEKMNQRFPELNKLECQLCSYFQLGLSSKDIGLITNLTSGTIRVYKVKIKQKLKLNNDQSLDHYLQEMFRD